MSGSPSRVALGEVARVFVRLGVIGFGGPAAHIALLRDELVRRRRWLDDAQFLELVGATNLIPGPNSTELAIHLGHRRAGWRGLLVAGIGFIAPAVVIVTVLAWLYERHGTDPAVVDLRYGILPVIIAIVAHALYGLGRTALTTPTNVVVAIASLAGFLVGLHELAILASAGVSVALWSVRGRFLPDRLAMVLVPPFAVQEAAGPTRVSLWRLLALFVEIGSVLYGSGYVLLAFLQRRLVDDLGWLTSRQLLDAVAIGQVTPGPVFTTATFVGWQLDGPAGAAVATFGIFAPAFVFVALLGRVVAWTRDRPVATAFLAGVTTASLGLMAGALIELADAAVLDALTAAVAVAALAVLVRTRLNSAWLIAAGAVVGAIHALVA